MFMGILEDNQNLTETVRTEFDALLKSKDSIIQDLQSKLVLANKVKEDATLKAQTHADENIRLNDLIEDYKKEYGSKMNDMQNALADKDSLNKVLTDSCNEQKQRLEELKKEHERVVVLADENSILHEKVKELEKELSEKAFENQKEILALREEFNNTIAGLKEKHQNEIDSYQQKYMALLEQQQTTPKKTTSKRTTKKTTEKAGSDT